MNEMYMMSTSCRQIICRHKNVHVDIFTWLAAYLSQFCTWLSGGAEWSSPFWLPGAACMSIRIPTPYFSPHSKACTVSVYVTRNFIEISISVSFLWDFWPCRRKREHRWGSWWGSLWDRPWKHHRRCRRFATIRGEVCTILQFIVQIFEIFREFYHKIVAKEIVVSFRVL